MSPPTSVTVRVPGSTSNCGSGFDALGLALRLYNHVTLTRDRDGPVRGERDRDRRAANLVGQAVAAFENAVGRKGGGFFYQIDGDVPMARGLGSSVTVLAGIAAGLNMLEGSPLSTRDLIALVTEIEGHPDNASAGILGGFCAARCEPASGRYLDVVRVEIPDSLAFVVVSPAHEIATRDSRDALPDRVPFFDAVKSVNSAVYLTAAFATGEFAKLRRAGGDFLHEPYRLPKIPGAQAAIEAGVAAGAFTGWLSGSGSSVLCVAERGGGDATAKAMQSAFAAAGIASEARLLAADNEGLRIEYEA